MTPQRNFIYERFMGSFAPRIKTGQWTVDKGGGKGAGKGTKTSEKGKGKGPFSSNRDADYEHAGVGIAIHQKWLKHLEELKEVSGRIMVLRFKGAGGSMAFISTYGPIAESKEKDKDAF